MKSNYPLILGSFFCVRIVLLTLPAQALPSERNGRGDRANSTTDRSGTYQSLHHGSGTFNSSVTRQPGSTTGTTIWTNQNGGQGIHSFDNTYTKTGNGTATGTGPNGGTKLIGNTETWTKTVTPNPTPASTPPPSQN